MTTLLIGSSKNNHNSLKQTDLSKVDGLWPDETTYRTRSYGQDMLAIVDSCRGILGPDERLFGVFDGHGECGHRWSQIAGELLLQKILQYWWRIKWMLRKKNGKSLATKQLKKLFRLTETDCLEPQFVGRNAPGGTTSTVSLVMIVRRRRWVIQASVGDSPGCLATVEDSETRVKEVIQGPTEANCDNVQAVTEYVNRHLSHGEKPPPIWFSRINANSSCAPRIPTGIDIHGRNLYQPLEAWRFFKSEAESEAEAESESESESLTVDVRPHLKNYRILQEQGHYIGTQTLNFPEQKLSDDGTRFELVNPERDAALNWGNTVEGEGQNTTGIGDIDAGLASDCDASVHFYAPEQCRQSLLVFSFSDGFGDILTGPTWAERFLELFSDPVLMESPERSQCWLRSTTEEAVPEHYRSVFGWSDRGGTFHPKWDDLSCVGVLLPPWSGSRRRRRH